MKKILTCIALLITIQLKLYTCTTFCIHTTDELVFGKNYDWTIGYGLVFVNKKNVEKTAFITKGLPAKWVSKYGSVTFNQYGREFPSGGMNEAGLVIELMWLNETKYPEADDRPAVGGILSWIQYQLDNAGSVEEVIQSDKVIRISQNSVPIHYLAADKSGKCVSIEFLDGRLVYHTGETMPVKILTNDTYEKSLEYLKRHEGFGGNEPVTNDKSSLGRFVTACSMVSSYTPQNGKTAVDYGFGILSLVAQGEHTKWSIIYDIKNALIYFRTADNSKIKNISLSGLDFTCAGEVKMIDINFDSEGNVNDKLSAYTFEANRRLIEDSYNGVDFLKNISAESRDKAAKYPEILNCADKSGTDNSKYQGRGNLSPMDYIFSPFSIALGFLIVSVVVLLKFKHRRK